MAAKRATTKRTARKAASKKRRSNKAPSAKQLAARRKFAMAAKARSKAAKAKKATTRKRNKTVIVKPKRVIVLDVGKPTRRKYRNGYLDLVIKGTAEKTPQGWKVGKKVIAQGKGIAPISSGYYLDKSTGMIFAKRARNVAAGAYYGGAFHPFRSSPDYDPGMAGETGGKPRHTRSKKKRAAVKKAIRTASDKAATRQRRATTSRLASRALSRSVPLRRTKKRNSAKTTPKIKAITESFSGRKVRAVSTLNVSNGTPANLAKLGKLVLIKAEKGTIKPTKPVWLCADAKGKLHLATTAERLIEGGAQNFGQVLQVEYETSKPHLGHSKPTIFFHKMGEEGGTRPELVADGNGGLKFRGGSYRITREGIVN